MNCERACIVLKVVLIVLGVVCIYVRLTSTIPRPMNWDEVDYITAADLGVYGNALEKGSLTALKFFTIGWAKLRNVPFEVDENERDDPFILRHFHPPLPVYLWSLAGRLADNNIERERLLRYTTISLAIAVTILMILMSSVSFEGANGKINGAVILPLLVTSPSYIACFSSLNFHAFLVFTSAVYLFALVRILRNPCFSNAIILGMSIGMMILSLETWILIIIVTGLGLISLGIWRNVHIKFWGTAFIASGVLSLLLWPSSIRTLGPMKSWMMYVYRIFRMGSVEYASVSLGSSLAALAKSEWPILTIALLVMVLLWADSRRKAKKTVYMPFVVTITYLFVIAPFALSSTYFGPGISMLFMAVMISLSYMDVGRKTRLSGLLISLVAMVLFLCWLPWNQMEVEAKARSEHDREMEEIHTYLDPQRLALADGGHILRYYLGVSENRIKGLHFLDYSVPGFRLRENYQYVNCSEEVADHNFNPIILRRGRPFKPELFRQLKDLGYQRIDLPHFLVFVLEDKDTQ